MCHTGQFDIDDIDAHLCTHLNYGFANMDNQTWKLVAYDPWSHMSFDHLMLMSIPCKGSTWLLLMRAVTKPTVTGTVTGGT